MYALGPQERYNKKKYYIIYTHPHTTIINVTVLAVTCQMEYKEGEGEDDCIPVPQWLLLMSLSSHN